MKGDQVLDSVCWTGKDGCAAAFKSVTPTTLVRTTSSATPDTAPIFEHQADYSPTFDPARPNLDLTSDGLGAEGSSSAENPANPEDPKGTEASNGSTIPTNPDDSTIPETDSDAANSETNSCYGLIFSELHTYFSDGYSEQYFEFYNPTDADIELNGCKLRYKKKLYPLSGLVKAESYLAIYPYRSLNQLKFTKNPSTSNLLELINTDQSVADSLEYYHGQKKSTAYALFHDADGSELWLPTYALTPGATNLHQEFRTCPSGKVINPKTGNCVNSSTASTTLEPCPAGKYRNPLTGRCKNLDSTESGALKPCAEGYERNPETNRCRKITAENDGAGYALTPVEYSDNTTFIAFGVLGLISATGLSYIIFQFRLEIARALRKARQRFHRIRKDLIARRVGLHRHKKS